MPTLIRNGIVLPMTGGRRSRSIPGSVLVDGDTIVAVGPVEEVDADPRAAGAEVVDATGHAVHPRPPQLPPPLGAAAGHGRVDVAVGLARGLRRPGPQGADARDRRRPPSLHCYTESVLAGTTSVMDMWRFMEGSAARRRADRHPGHARALRRRRARATTTSRRSSRTGACWRPTAPRPTGGCARWVGLEHLFYCSPECFRDALRAGRGVRHRASTPTRRESIWEVQESLKRFGRRPIEEFYNRGILGERTVVAHCVWLDDREIELLAPDRHRRSPTARART